MDKLLNYNIRSGIHVNMVQELTDIENAYRIDLKSSFDVFDTKDEVDNEMLNDEIKYKALIDLYEHLGYIDDEEAEAIRKELTAVRLEVIKSLEKENNENGKEN